MKAVLFDATGVKKGEVELNDNIFEAKINQDLMHRAVVMRLANARKPIAHTMTRGEVSASTRKMFRQKGTGRARRGARSTSLLRGGGVTHGPRNTSSFSKGMPKKERRQALFSALSAKAQGGDVFILEKFEGTVPSTKSFVSLLSKLPNGKKYLFVISEKSFVFECSVSNVPNVKVLLAPYANPYDVLDADKVCFLQDSLPSLEATFL
jgi:large subunit ribosomal protein L4